MHRLNKLGKYRLIRLLGRGAMGVVYLAEHELMKAKYAVKVLPDGMAYHPGFKERFVAEAKAMARLKHPNIVNIHYMDNEDNRHFLVMDFVTPDQNNPQSLDDLLEARYGRLSVNETQNYFKQICEAVIYAHEQGLIHRDIKPSNVLIDRDRIVRLSDFGLAKVIGDDVIRKSIAQSLSGSLGSQNTVYSKFEMDDSLGTEQSLKEDSSSSAESLVGTYHYMPPEVQQGGEWTKQGDIFSLGVLAYRMLVGTLPIGRFELPSEINESIPKEWDELVDVALKTNPERRWASVSKLQECLELMESKPNIEVIQESLPQGKSAQVEIKHEPNPGDTITIDLPNLPIDAKPLEMVWISPGNFLMGSPRNEKGRNDNEGPQHRVTLTKGFYMGKFPVTQAQWELVMGDNPSEFKGKDHPVECISWEDCQEFLIDLNKLLKLDRKFRLPTEAEWEYACRAGTETRFYWGDDEDETEITKFAWYRENSKSKTHKIGKKLANNWGLYDMSGNIDEWCQDNFVLYSRDDKFNPKYDQKGFDRVLRGGSWWDYEPINIRSANRSGNPPKDLDNNIGCRLVLD